MDFLQIVKQIIRFLSAGGLGLALYYIALYVLTDVFKVWYLLSATIASVLNYSFNFLIHKFWTFQNKDVLKIYQQAGKYLALVICIIITNLLLLYVLVEYIHLWYIAAQVIVTIFLTIISYYVSRKIWGIPS